MFVGWFGCLFACFRRLIACLFGFVGCLCVCVFGCVCAFFRLIGYVSVCVCYFCVWAFVWSFACLLCSWLVCLIVHCAFHVSIA